MQGGGWALSDIEANFTLCEQNIGTVPVKTTQSFESNAAETKQKKRMSIFGINLLIFIGYYLFAVISSKLLKSNDFGTIYIFFGYMVHAALLILISIIEGIRGVHQKVKTRAGQYFLTAILLLIIGFGVCTFTYNSGIMNLNL